MQNQPILIYCLFPSRDQDNSSSQVNHVTYSSDFNLVEHLIDQLRLKLQHYQPMGMTITLGKRETRRVFTT
jgi:hypothetical protein